VSQFDPLTLYGHCVQDAPMTVQVLRAIHGANPRRLSEDFSGTARVSLQWVRTDPAARALAIDLDADALNRARHPRLTSRIGDVLSAPPTPKVDVIWVGNFSIGEIHSRDTLIAYLRRARARLNAGGVLVCDLYDGPSAWKPGVSTRRFTLEPGVTVLYRWRQVSAVRRTRMVHNCIDFHVSRAGSVTRLSSAFVYHWRLWSPRSLARSMREAGFGNVEFYPARLDALDGQGQGYIQPRKLGEFDRNHIVLVTARR
jgi:hypothetical protein